MTASPLVWWGSIWLVSIDGLLTCNCCTPVPIGHMPIGHISLINSCKYANNFSWLIPGCKDIENQLLHGNYMLCNISNNLASYDSFNMVVTAAFVDVFTVATRSMQHLRLLKISHTYIGWTPSCLVLPLVFQKPDNLPKGILKPVGFTLSFTAL